MLNRYSRSPQRHATAGDAHDEFVRLACLTYRPSWRVGPGEVADDVRRHTRARELLAAQPDLAAQSIYSTVRSFLTTDPSLANREGALGWPPLLYLMCSRAEGDAAPEVAALLLARGADPNAGYLPDGEPPPVTALSSAFRGYLDPSTSPRIGTLSPWRDCCSRPAPTPTTSERWTWLPRQRPQGLAAACSGPARQPAPGPAPRGVRRRSHR
jgi:hypothetical protein